MATATAAACLRAARPACGCRWRSEEAALRRFCLCIAFVFVGGLAFRISAPELRAQERQGTSDIAVVVSTDNPISDISLASLRRVVLGDMTSWKNHASVVLLLRPEGT